MGKTACFLIFCCFATANLANDVSHDVRENLEKNYDLQEPRLPDIEKIVKDLLEDFRQFLLNGVESLGIPPLDPLEIANITTGDINTKPIKGNLQLLNFVLKGLSDFELESVFITNSGFHLAVKLSNLNFGPAVLSTEYNGNLELLELMQVYGEGTIEATIKDFAIDELTIAVKYSRCPIILSSIEIKLTLPTITMKITGLFNDDHMSDIISRQLSETINAFLKHYKPDLDDALISISEKLVVILNPILAGMNCEKANTIETTEELVLEVIRKLAIKLLEEEESFLKLANNIFKNYYTKGT